MNLFFIAILLLLLYTTLSFTNAKTINFIPHSSLLVSEPNPRDFGNSANPSPSSPQRKYWTNNNWLKSRFHFSFAEYEDYKRTNFGVLRVLNDDLVQPSRGFGPHPHRNAEIVSVILEGELTHQDSMGNKETLGRGSIQYMSAGTGVTHSEHNRNPHQPVRFLQLWFSPRSFNTQPRYGSVPNTTYDFPQVVRNKFFHLVGENKELGCTHPPPAFLQTDVNMYLGEFFKNSKNNEEEQFASFIVKKNRAIYLVCAEGDQVEVNVVKKKSQSNSKKSKVQIMSRHDAMTVSAFDNDEEVEVEFSTQKQQGNSSFFLVVEMKNPISNSQHRRQGRSEDL